jgi:uncharacterized protein YjbJ (UPF0337 family)
MGLPNKDEMEGKFDQAKGSAKKGVGRILNDPKMQNEGEADKASGNVKETFGKARRKVGEAIEDIGDKLAR